MARDILDEIIENKRTELIRQKQAVSPAELRTRVMDREPRPKDYRSLRAALCQSKSGIIAEFKRKSPSKGWIHPEAKVADVLPTYERSGAAACSILTDSDFFGGSLGDLREARSLVKLPLLRKDFIIDPYQIDQALLAGADAILLIAAALSPDQYDELADQAHEAGLEVLWTISARIPMWWESTTAIWAASIPTSRPRSSWPTCCRRTWSRSRRAASPMGRRSVG